MELLEKAIVLAAKAHSGQLDKAGEPYILHPLRVMLSVSSMEERIVAVLHDVVEDAQVTLKDIRAEGFDETIVDALDSVTKRSGESYEAFILRAAANPIGYRVKIADLEDNSNISRIAKPTERDYRRVEKYRCAMKTLEAFRPKAER